VFWFRQVNPVGYGSQVYKKSSGGISATHPKPEMPLVWVTPSNGDEHNTIKAGIIPYACWKVEDMRFEFDSSIIKPDMADELQDLSDLIEEHTKSGQRPPASIFGHADPVGQDDYNKQLSGRRAKALYALLTRNVEMWEELYTQPFGGDSWREKKATTMMLSRMGYGDTDPEIRRFQQDQGLEVDGIMGPNTRKALYKAYMDAICPIALNPQQDFLGRGQDPDGKADYQGCGEFNPLMLFSEEEQKEYSKPEKREERNRENAPNRRVMVFLFRPGTNVNPERWPCPRAKESGAGCRKRFWSDGERRRTERLPDQRRKYKDTKDTFACRFYDRLASSSPCEGVPFQFRIRLCDPFGRPIPDAPYRITYGGKTGKGKADTDGWIMAQDLFVPDTVNIEWGYPPDESEPDNEGKLRADTPGIESHDSDDLTGELVFRMLVYTQINDEDRDQAAYRRLHNIGYSYEEDDDEAEEAAVRAFQLAYAEYGLKPTGEVDEPTYEVLKDVHDSTELRHSSPKG